MKLAFGCGHLDHHSQGYKNVDIRSMPHIDFVVDISGKLPWESNSIEEIIAESVLEHIPHGFMNGDQPYPRAHLNTIRVLSEWCRVLKPGGRCVVKVPNIKGLVHQYLHGMITYRDFWTYVYGGQEYKENTHVSGFDPETIIELLTISGFRDVRVGNAHTIEETLDELHAWEMSAIGIK